MDGDKRLDLRWVRTQMRDTDGLASLAQPRRGLSSTDDRRFVRAVKRVGICRHSGGKNCDNGAIPVSGDSEEPSLAG